MIAAWLAHEGIDNTHCRVEVDVSTKKLVPSSFAAPLI